MLEKFSPKEVSEIERVRGILKEDFRKILGKILRNRNEDVSDLVGGMCSGIFDEGGMDVVVRGEENLSDEEGAVFACNHGTHSEKYFVLPKNPVFNYAPPLYLLEAARQLSAKTGRDTQSLFSADNMGMKMLVNASGNIPVPRVNRHMKNEERECLNERVKEALGSGKNIAVCPEGKFWGEKEDNGLKNIGPFGKGTYHIAKNNNVPVVPVILDGFNRAGSKEFSIDIKEPMTVGVEETAAEFMERVRQVFVDNGFERVGD